jgi:hypothetical protein
MDDDDLIHELNELIQLDYDASRTYEVALEHVDDEAARADLRWFMQDHLQHITDLRSAIGELGGTAIQPSRDLKGVLLEGMTKLRSVTGTLGALKAMRMNEQLTNRSYDKAMALPPEVRVVVERNLADERRHLAAIGAHLARLRVAGGRGADDDDAADASVDAPAGRAGGPDDAPRGSQTRPDGSAVGIASPDAPTVDTTEPAPRPTFHV